MSAADMQKELDKLNAELALAKRDHAEKVAQVAPAKARVDEISTRITQLGQLVARQEQSELMAPSELRDSQRGGE